MSKCMNEFGCIGVSLEEGFYIARIKINNKQKIIGKFELLESAIACRMLANKQYGITNQKRLINSLTILRNIYATETKPIKYNYKIESNSNYHWLVEQDKIENACRVDPTKEYSNINKIIESLGY